MTFFEKSLTLKYSFDNNLITRILNNNNKNINKNSFLVQNIDLLFKFMFFLLICQENQFFVDIP